MKKSQSKLSGSNPRSPPYRRVAFVSLLDVRRLQLRLLHLLHRLGCSLLDVKGELHVVVVDANAIVRLQRPAQQEPRELVLELSLDRASQRPSAELGVEAGRPALRTGSRSRPGLSFP
jgi:hypothetical protein